MTDTTEEFAQVTERHDALMEERDQFFTGIAKLLAGSSRETQAIFMQVFAQTLTVDQLNALSEEIDSFADDEEETALCRLARAVNRRDAGLLPGDDV